MAKEYIKKKKESNIVSKAVMVKYIRERLQSEYGLEGSRELVNAVLDIFDDEIYTIIAQNQAYKCLWGTIGGMSKPPVKVSGKFVELKSVIDNHGYSTWKNGYPYIQWSSVCKVYDINPPEDYFNLPEVRYTTAARTFRKDSGMPEIPEFENLSEEKIKEICDRADKIQFESMGAEQRRNKKRDDKFNEIKLIAYKEYWKKINYIPCGSTDGRWDGKNRDTIDFYLGEHLKEEDSPVDKLETIRIAKDLAEYKLETEKHPELNELEEKYKKEIEEQGLEEIPHVKKIFENTHFTLRYRGQKNPWEIQDVSISKTLKLKRIERDKKALLDSIEEANDEVKNDTEEEKG